MPREKKQRERERDGSRASLKLGILIRRRSRRAETPLTSTYFSLFVYTRDPCVNWRSCRRKKMSRGRNTTRGKVDGLIIEARERTLANENGHTPWEVTHENPSPVVEGVSAIFCDCAITPRLIHCAAIHAGGKVECGM